MSVAGVVTATAIVGGVGLFIGLFLGLAAIKFKVEVDEKEEALWAWKRGKRLRKWLL